jgi:hypothetical protein
MPHTEIRIKLADLVRETAAIDILGHENADVTEVRSIAYHLMTLVARANALCDALVNVEPPLLEDEEFSEVREHLRKPGGHSLPAIDRAADLAFIMRMELMHKQRGLENALNRPRIHLLAECETCQRRLTEGLSALETCLTGSNRPPSMKGIEASLVARQAYAKFRTQVAVLPRVEADQESLRRGLRAAGTLIAILVGSDAYPQFRVADRHHVSALQRRILAFLAEPTSLGAGIDLYQDFKAFVELLALINRRQDLRQHDLVHLRGWLTEIDAEPERVDEPLARLERYRSHLYGLDTELDRVFEGHTIVDRMSLVGLLEGLVNTERAPPGERPTKPEHGYPSPRSFVSERPLKADRC